MPTTNLRIADDTTIEILNFPNENDNYDFAVVENLPNLKELHIAARDVTPSKEKTWLKWLICRNLPKLKKVVISGGLMWLEIDSAENLKLIDVGQCKKLEHFSVKSAPALEKIIIKNCRKLRCIADLDLATQERMGITKQINLIQSKSRYENSIYKDMTYRDVEALAHLINTKIKLAAEQGYLGEGKYSRLIGEGANAPAYTPFSFELLGPLEHVPTDGIDHLYPSPYAFYESDYDGDRNAFGKNTQENCLKQMLNCASDLDSIMPTGERPKERDVLVFFSRLKKSILPKYVVALRNDELPENEKVYLSAEFFQQLSMDAFSQLIISSKIEQMRSLVESYSKNSLPCCLPKYLPFDKKNASHRFEDQIIRGFPFTSENHSWPVDSVGDFMQPLAQINLETASTLLNVNLGNGLLQVWMAINPGGKKGADSWNPKIRIIPKTALNEQLDSFYPDMPVWDRDIEDEDEDEECATECLIYANKNELPNVRIQWLSVGSMFPNVAHQMSEWCEDNGISDERDQYRLFDEVDSSGIPNKLETVEGKREFAYLGGFIANSDNAINLVTWPYDANNVSQKKNLLFISNCDIFSFTLIYFIDHEGQAQFRSKIVADN